MREWVGAKVVKNLVATGFSIKNRTFENTASVPREDIEDDRIGIYGNAFKLLNLDTSHYKGAMELVVCPWIT